MGFVPCNLPSQFGWIVIVRWVMLCFSCLLLVSGVGGLSYALFFVMLMLLLAWYGYAGFMQMHGAL